MAPGAVRWTVGRVAEVEEEFLAAGSGARVGVLDELPLAGADAADAAVIAFERLPAGGRGFGVGFGAGR